MNQLKETNIIDESRKEQIAVYSLSESQYFSDVGKVEFIYKSSIIFSMTKRSIDLLASIIALIILFPLMIIVAIVIKIESPGPVIYKQLRLGQFNREFYIYKFRSMVNNAEQNGPVWAKTNDVRITKIGRFLRLSRIDELPQLVNVIMGDMSLIGPRPERKYFIEKFTQETPDFLYRTLVKPGITGLAQVNGGYELSPEQKLEKDLEYIRQMNLKLEVMIVLKTIKVLFTHEGAR